ncbi:hydrogenase iron-sulfur subunit, partial [Candidatus Desantisbacteria bacterium]|nr:hydrogenase iron-sulfur subunit [Candidatus Desantisbacteria bacterium]
IYFKFFYLGLQMKIIAFCCHNALERVEFKDTFVKVVLLPCSSKIEVGHLLKTFEAGADRVMVVGCREGECQFVDGCRIARGRVAYTKKLLQEIGLDGERLDFFNLSNSEEFLEAMEIMKERFHHGDTENTKKISFNI